VLCNQVPLIFVRGELYGSATWGGALVLLGLQALDVAAVTVAWVGMAVILAARLLTMAYRITLPTYAEKK
jgi:uncharacterized membrane protein YeiH